MDFILTVHRRVKLPKTFLAVNLSDAFSWEEQERNASDNDVLEMKSKSPKDLLLGSDNVVDNGEKAAPETDDAISPSVLASG
jgi:hypothetical protein